MSHQSQAIANGLHTFNVWIFTMEDAI